METNDVYKVYICCSLQWWDLANIHHGIKSQPSYGFCHVAPRAFRSEDGLVENFMTILFMCSAS